MPKTDRELMEDAVRPWVPLILVDSICDALEGWRPSAPGSNPIAEALARIDARLARIEALAKPPVFMVQTAEMPEDKQAELAEAFEVMKRDGEGWRPIIAEIDTLEQRIADGPRDEADAARKPPRCLTGAQDPPRSPPRTSARSMSWRPRYRWPRAGALSS